MAKNKKIEDEYKLLSDIEHVLQRPHMYIGSVTSHSGENYLFDGINIEFKEFTYNPGFNKIFDEIISNSVDEHRDNKKLNEIRVTFNLDTLEITVWDNGGIPVVKHKENKMWIPEMVFSNLKAGSNFNDDEDRKKAGTNGVGSTLTNIYSTRFSVKTCDGKNKFEQVYSNNMNKRTPAKITKSTKGFTEISYIPDLSRFKMRSINDDSYKLLFKRCLGAAACNPRLKIKVTTIKDGKKSVTDIKFKKFEDYIQMYKPAEYFYEESKDWKIGFSESNSGFKNISYINSVHTKNGGTHVDYITNQLIAHLREMIKKKHKVMVKPSDIRNHLCVYVECTVINPGFDSQTKDELITEVREFKTQHEVTEKLAKQIFGSNIIQSVLDWVERKQLAEERAELRKLNKSLSKGRVEKLIDAQKKGDRSKCILGIYEGDCLDENQKIKIINSDGKLIDSKIKNAKIGDYVISKDNSIEEIYEVSKKVAKSLIIKLKNGSTIKSSRDHRFLVYDKDAENFKYLEVSNLDTGKHLFIKNKLINIESFNSIIEINDLSDSEISLVLDNDTIHLSKTTKTCVFDKLDYKFIMIESRFIDVDRHIFIGFTKI